MVHFSNILGISESESLFAFKKKNIGFIEKKQRIFESFLNGIKHVNSENAL